MDLSALLSECLAKEIDKAILFDLFSDALEIEDKIKERHNNICQVLECDDFYVEPNHIKNIRQKLNDNGRI